MNFFIPVPALWKKTSMFFIQSRLRASALANPYMDLLRNLTAGHKFIGCDKLFSRFLCNRIIRKISKQSVSIIDLRGIIYDNNRKACRNLVTVFAAGIISGAS